MNSHAPPEGSSPFPNEIDLSDIFIGREQQLDQFRFYLERWQRLAVTATIPDLKVPPSPNDKIQGFVALLHGRGGFGKSTLLKRYRELALEYGDDIQVSNLIDWEFAAQERRALFSPAQRETINASEYFGFMRDQLALALGRPRTDFKEYQVAVRAVDHAKKQAQGVLKGLQQDDRYAWLRSLPGNIVLALIQSVPVVGNLPLLKNDAITEAISDATNMGVSIGVEQIAQVRMRLHEQLGADLSADLNAPWRLGRAIGHDLAQFARRRPILIFFDTYEEIDEGDKLLQMIMGAAGGRVGWVIAGRDNLWAGVGQRRRSLEVEYGYRDLVLPDRRMVIDFSADGVGDFTSSDIEEYFTQLSHKALRPVLPAVSERDAIHIREVTGGVPLAVKIAAGLYLESLDLALITESLDGKREIVDQMVERYLLHTRTNPADRSRLYGLALLRRPDEPRSLAAALDVPENYDAELARLHRRYGFIFTKQEQPALHQEVRYFLRLWLLQHRTSNLEIMRVISRLREALFTSFQELEAQRHYRSLSQRLEDEQWIALYLDLTEQQFWLDPAEGVAYVLPFMFAASVYQREANRVARTIGEFFQATLVQPYRKQWDWANQSLVYSTSGNPLREELSGLKEVVRLASQNNVAFFPPMPPFQEELEAAVWWRLGEAYRGRSPNECVYWYEQALGRLPHREDLHEALAEAKLDRERAATEEEPATPPLPGGMPDTQDDGAGGTTTNGSQRAIEELDRALERDPKSVHAYIQRGKAYLQLGEYRRAIADLDHALELAPQNASPYAKRGEAYLLLKEYRRAITDFDRTLELEPQNASPYAKRGEAYLQLREYRRAITDFDRALELEPGNETFRTKRNEASLELTKPPRKPPRPPRPIRRAMLLIGLALLVVAGGVLGSVSLLAHFGVIGARSGPSAPTLARINVARGGTWTDDLYAEPDSLIPNASVATASYMVDQAIYAPLFVGDSTGKITPGIATEIPTVANGGISADLTTWTFHLRPGLKWSDGMPLDARDVDFSWRLWTNPNFPAGGTTGFDLITSTDISPDNLSITFHLKQAFSPFVSIWVDGINAPLPAHHFQGIAPDKILTSSDNLDPLVTSGPFKMSESKPGDHYTVVRNPNYYLASQGYPYLDSVVFRIVPSPDSLLKDLQAGTIDSAFFLDVTQINLYQQLSNFSLSANPDTAKFEAMYFNFHNAILGSHSEVRRAMAMAVNHQALISTARRGEAVPLCTDHGKAYAPGYQADAPCPKFDPAAANALLDQNGWVQGADGVRTKNGMRLEFEYSTATSIEYSTTTGNTWQTDDELVLQRNMQAIGIKLDIQNYPIATFFGPFLSGGNPSPPTGAVAGRYDIAEFVNTWYYDPDDSSLLSCNQNLDFYCNPALNTLYGQELATADPGLRQQLFGQIHQIYLSDFPFVVLYSPTDIGIHKKNLHNYDPAPEGASETINIWQWWCDGGHC